jgi:hypothetical protein
MKPSGDSAATGLTIKRGSCVETVFIASAEHYFPISPRCIRLSEPRFDCMAMQDGDQIGTYQQKIAIVQANLGLEADVGTFW